MTKEEYLKALELALIEKGVSNYLEIVEKYRKRFELASLADMTTEEAIKMMGSIDSVVNKYCDGDKTEYYDVYTFKLEDALASEIVIRRGVTAEIFLETLFLTFLFTFISTPFSS